VDWTKPSLIVKKKKSGVQAMVMQNHRWKITSKKKWSGQAKYGEGK